MPDREKVIAWLTEISLRPCDFVRDDFDAYETEHLANEALEICEDAKVFNQQRNNALALLKEQEAVEPKVSSADQRCGNCNKVIEMDGWKACPWCGKIIDWKRWWDKNGTHDNT